MASGCVAALTALATFRAITAATDRRAAAVAVRRLAPRAAAREDERRAGRPMLIAAAGAAGGRMAIRLLERLRLKPAVERLLDTAALRWGAAGLLHRSVALLLVGFTAVALPTGNTVPGLALAAGAALALLPLWYARRKARLRVAAFEQQFPDCLEFLSRSMRAGHAFSVAVEMVAAEYGGPLAAEFRRVFEEQHLGQALEIVLRKLARRMPSMDVQIFVSAVVLQKRTGGNLAELLDKLAQLIRERFKLRARIRAVSAQGMISGRILSSIPLAVGLLMFGANPQYARFFVDDPVGRELMAGALGLQVVGYLIIRKIVTIEV